MTRPGKPPPEQRGTVVTDAAGDPVTVQAGFVGIGPASETVQQPVTAVLPMVGENVQAEYWDRVYQRVARVFDRKRMIAFLLAE